MNSGEAYKKVANEGKRVRIFYIETEIKKEHWLISTKRKP